MNKTTQMLKAIKIIMEDDENNDLEKLLFLGRMARHYTLKYVELIATMNDCTMLEAFGEFMKNEKDKLEEMFEEEAKVDA